MNESENMRIYEAVRKPPAEALKPFSNGSFSGTDINPMWRIKAMTERFGPCGIGWYIEPVSMRAETYGETVMAIVDINLYIKVNGEWSKPIFGTGGNLLVQSTKNGARPSDEGYKKAYTDAISNACKMLGVGADVWYSKDPDAYDPTSKYSDKYVKDAKFDESKLPNTNAVPATVKSIPVCEECGQPIKTAMKGDKVIMTQEDIVNNSNKAYKRTLCLDCCRKMKEKAG